MATQIRKIAIGPKDKVGNWINNLIVTFKSLHFRFEPITDEEKIKRCLNCKIQAPFLMQHFWRPIFIATWFLEVLVVNLVEQLICYCQLCYT